jgi:hypothetical protein
VLYLRSIILSVVDDIFIDSDMLLVTDFINLKIKPAQSFVCAHRGRVVVHIFIWIGVHTCMSIYVCTIFLKNNTPVFSTGKYH